MPSLPAAVQRVCTAAVARTGSLLSTTRTAATTFATAIVAALLAPALASMAPCTPPIATVSERTETYRPPVAGSVHAVPVAP